MISRWVIHRKHRYCSSIWNRFIPCCFLLILLSCKKDIPPKLECDLSHPDQICREDAFRRGEFLGYIEYSYLHNNQLHQKKYYSMSQSYLEETFSYNSKNQLTYQKNVDGEGNIKIEKRIEHNEFDSVSCITVTQNKMIVESTNFDYDVERRLSFRYDWINGSSVIHSYIYGDDNRLFRENIFDESEHLLSYKIYKNYLNNVTKVFEYDHWGELQNIEVILQDVNNNVVELRQYDNNNVLRKQQTFLYVGNKLVKHAWLTGGAETEFRLFHYP